MAVLPRLLGTMAPVLVFCLLCSSIAKAVAQQKQQWKNADEEPIGPHYVHQVDESGFRHRFLKTNEKLNAVELMNRIKTRPRPDTGVNPGEHAFMFFPPFRATLFPSTPAQWIGQCFNQTKASMEVDPSNGHVLITLIATSPKSLLCEDIYFIGDSEAWYLWRISKEGQHTLSIEANHNQEIEDLQVNGMQFFLVTEGILGTIRDVVDTILMFRGPWTRQIALEFVQANMGFTYTPRSAGWLNVSHNLIESGDYVATQRFDGLEVMIQYGTGSHSGHSTIAMWLDGALHVCESTGETDYWPPPYGHICTPWDQWMQQAHEANYLVSVMRLAPELRALWNQTAAEQFVKSNLGCPYGYWNFIYGWIDTVNENFPPPLSAQFFEIFTSMWDRAAPQSAHQYFIEGLNKRMGTHCGNMTCVWSNLYATNQSLLEVFTEPEMDDWIYTAVKNGTQECRSMVCNVFVQETMMAAGIFGDLASQIQAAEFTPKDFYTLNIWDTAPKWSFCANSPDPVGTNGAVCQLMGDYVAQFNGWNTITPYANMAETCPSMPPEYYRPPGC